jgi:hypothetical protein
MAAAAVAAIAGGCAGANQPASLTLASVSQPAETASVAVSTTELYSRLARGAMACWFSPGGPLKDQYIYNADADAEAEGGKAEIIIHIRDLGAQNPRGLKAFRVSITPGQESGTARLAVENLKMPEPMSENMKKDVQRWSGGDIACAEPGSDWAPKPPEPPAATTADKGKKKSRGAKKAAQNNI